jgi:hypothetical protein
MLKKYKLWWLISVGLASFISFNWVLFGLTGLTLIRPNSELQGITQALVWILSVMCSFEFADEGKHKELQIKPKNLPTSNSKIGIN